MKTIPLTQGKVTVVDNKDYKYLSRFKWYAKNSRGSFYAARNVSLGGTKQTTIKMHQVIMGARNIDHKDGDGLNNRRKNLRKVLHANNCMNRRRNKNNTTGFKGVSARRERFRAQIQSGKVKMYIGSFSTPEEAHAAYCTAASKLHGAFARFA